jgi:pantetheine-phosphate adenylyltransferase
VRERGHAVLGGTFDHFHRGHAVLLATAFRVGRSVSIGVTTDRFVAAHPKPFPGRIQPYAVRRRALVRWVARHYRGRSYRAVPLKDPFGRSVEDGVDVLVLSADTLAGGRAVNAERRRLGRRSVPLEVVPVVLADDLRPISSRRVRAGEIDPQGRRRSVISVGIGVSDPRDGPAALRAVRSVFPAARIRWLALGGRPPAPRGVAARARALARRAVHGRELGFGVARAPDGRRSVVERTVTTELTPWTLPPLTLSGFQRALRGLVKPGVERKTFETPRSSRD